MSDAKDPGDDEIRERLRLTLVPGVGPTIYGALLDRFGSARRVVRAGRSALRQVEGVGPVLADRIAASTNEVDAEAERLLCVQNGVTLLFRDQEGYPPSLREIHDPPPLLYCRGRLDPADELAVAIVGSRRCTPYGLRTAEKLARSLARAGLAVVSGLARGIDAAAHRAALQAGGRTIAVVANGLVSVYPPENAELAEQVARSGAILSEMPMRQEPLAGLFPQRNRVIAGLSLGVVVVEAAPRSGSLLTARHAMEQNREVFAVPGPVDSLASRGCHQLLRDGAALVETVDDIIEALKPQVRERVQKLRASLEAEPAEPSADPPASASVTPRGLAEQELAILGHLDDLPRPVDELISRTGLAASQVMATLSVLQVRRLVRRMPGNQFVRV